MAGRQGGFEGLGRGGSIPWHTRPGTDKAGSSEAEDPDFEEEGRKLIARLNLEGGKEGGRYEDLNCVFKHPTSGGRVFIGNISAASTREILDAHGIRRVVNCQGAESKNFFEKGGEIKYFRFPVSFWRRRVSSPPLIVDFFQPVFTWIDEGVAQGDGVLIHCLAGAHRAGTTGVAYMMHAGRVHMDVALATAKHLRPIVNPFAGLLDGLTLLDRHITFEDDGAATRRGSGGQGTAGEAGDRAAAAEESKT